MLFKKLFNIFAQKSCGSYARFSNFSNFYACKFILTIFGLDSSHLHLFYRIFCLFVLFATLMQLPRRFCAQIMRVLLQVLQFHQFYACKLILTIFGMDSSHLHLFCRIFFLLFTNMKEMFCYPAKFLLLTNQAHALADRANDCGQAQNMTMPRHHNKSLHKLSNWN